MEADFWHNKWEKNQIGFHEGTVNRMLKTCIERLSLAPNARIFLPFCGKTRDIAWLLAQGFRVAGAELSDTAVQQLFDEMGITPVITQRGALKHYASDGLDIFSGDIFELDRDALGAVDAVYDRAALVALPKDMRTAYVAHVADICAVPPQLVISFEYDQATMQGPPFSIPGEEIRRFYESRYELSLLLDAEVDGGLKGFCPAQEQAWYLKPKMTGS